MPRVLLSTVYRPFCVDDPYDSPLNQVQHGTSHRQFTREQGIFTIHQQCSNLGLHMIAANIDAQCEVAEYPSLEELEDLLRQAQAQGRPYDYLGITTSASYLRKARRICQRAKAIQPGIRTVIGGAGAMAVGELVEPFSDHLCTGDGIRYFRTLLDQDPEAPVKHPPVPANQHANVIAGVKANPPSFSLAVSLGCHRGCEFCSTSAQFGHQRVPILRTAEEIFAAMKRVEYALAQNGPGPQAIHFLLFDENFLSNSQLARSFQRLNQQQLARGPLFLPFIFADAAQVSRFDPEDLLRMGVDSLWIGMENAPSRKSWGKNRDVDFRHLVEELQSHGIKVFLSFIAGTTEQSRQDVEADIAYALRIGAAGYQYAMACPFPGTPYYERMKSAGHLDISRPEVVGMSHYYLRHPDFDDAGLRALTTEFQRRDYERHGPLALRYMRLRLAGYRRHRRSQDPALRARAQGFRNDMMDASGILSLGRELGPNPRVRRLFRSTQRKLRRELNLAGAALDAARGRATWTSWLQFAAFTVPLTEPAARWLFVAHALRSDPRSAQRCSGITGLLRHGRACMEEVRHGMMPFDQPRLLLTRYPLAQAPPLPERRSLPQVLRGYFGRKLRPVPQPA